MADREIYEFGQFALEVAERRLLQAGQAVPLTPKAYDLLVVLVRNAGRLVTKRDLLEQVWPESFVEEGILSVHVSSLRKILGRGDGSRRHIETVAGSGYRFIDAVALRKEGTRKPARPERAYELFGIGRSHLLAASMFEVPKAVEAFRGAIELDPTYAEAYAGLAVACCAQAMTRMVPFAKAYSDAKAAALQALAIDPACADANVALGEVLFLSEWNWAGAERSLRRALQTNPNHTEAPLPEAPPSPNGLRSAAETSLQKRRFGRSSQWRSGKRRAKRRGAASWESGCESASSGISFSSSSCPIRFGSQAGRAIPQCDAGLAGTSMERRFRIRETFIPGQVVEGKRWNGVTSPLD